MSPRTLVWGVWLLGLTTGVLAVLGLRAWHERGARGDLERFAAVRAFAEEAYVGGVDGDALLEDALSGMLEGLDRYSRFYPPEDAAQLERELGIGKGNLSRWKRQSAEEGQDAFPGHGRQTPEQEELRKLRRENEILRQERDILKKAIAIFSERKP